MNFTEFTLGSDDGGKRLDRVLKRVFAQEASVNVHALLRKKLILLNGEKASGEMRVKEGDLIKVASFLLQTAAPGESAPSGNVLSKETLEWLSSHTLFRNEHVWALNKEAGLLVQKSSAEQVSLSDFVSSASENLNKDRGNVSFRAGPLHRLDRFTSGVVLFSQSHEGALRLAESISSHRVKKKYLAVVEGSVKESALYEDYLAESSGEGGAFFKMRVASSGESGSKLARTFVEPLCFGKLNGILYTVLTVGIETGRKHQIRCQCASHGHPLLGDSAYGSKNSVQSLKENMPPFLLHALSLEFCKEDASLLNLPQKIEAPLPEYFSQFMSRL